MIQVALIEPEIPPNTGNVIRLCANSGAALHLVRPLGFTLDHAKLRRAGLDYHEHAAMQVHDDVAALRAATGNARWFVFTTKGSQRYDQVQWQAGDVLLFGAESRGLPDSLIETVPLERRVYQPQRPGMRSLNLSNAVAVAVYEAWRQLAYAGAREPNS